jgi:Histidine kinase
LSDSTPASRSRARRAWPRALVWLQLVIGWLPVFVLYTGLIVSQHQPVTVGRAAVLALRSLIPAALLGVLVYRFAQRMPWPRPFRLRFALVHLVAAIAYSVTWILCSSLVESVIHLRLMIVIGPGIVPFLVVGVWLYVMVAGISYAIEGTERAARADAERVRMQLGALRSQLNPHFLFNALHTVVQLIPIDPRRAADAAEQVAALLRTTLQDGRDLVSLRDEWAFVSRYLELERIRFGDRLRVRTEIDPALLESRVPSFALQTLVENAVRHGAAPRVEPTDITITARATEHALTLAVRDTGAGLQSRAPGVGASSGTGLARLRDRLAALYGDASSLALEAAPDGGCAATLVLPRSDEE